MIRNNCVQQIKDEADIQKLCGHHPFIVQHLDSWQDRHHLYIRKFNISQKMCILVKINLFINFSVCEYVSNGELFSKICNFTTELIRLYVAEIALAIGRISKHSYHRYLLRFSYTLQISYITLELSIAMQSQKIFF